MDSSEILKFCHKLPKAELHAHLSGSVSQQTLHKLSQLQGIKIKQSSFEFSSLVNCLQSFKKVHQLLQSVESLYIATNDVIEEFMKDGVKYLELRTTPRHIAENCNKVTYLETIVNVIKKKRVDNPQTHVCLLVSIDRGSSIEEAWENLNTVLKFHTQNSDIVVGLDLSGNPCIPNIKDFCYVLNVAKNEGIKLSLHVAEVQNENISDILNLQPDRIGHGTFLSFDHIINFLQNPKTIPIEICLTSNILCHTVETYQQHHFEKLWNMKHPVILCTDDKGIFNTTLSQEYAIASKHFNLTKYNLIDLAKNSFKYAFSDIEKSFNFTELGNFEMMLKD